MQTVQAQIANSTSFGRIEGELRTARAAMGSRPLKILSFGCSIGYEVWTILTIFPDAQVFGCDINTEILAAAQRNVGHLATVFYSTREGLEQHGPFDIIVASAVLCLNPPTDIKTAFPFGKFEQLVHWLDECLSPGGLLILQNASYRFAETDVFSSYDVVRSDVVYSSGFVNLYARDGTLLLKQQRFLNTTLYSREDAFSVAEDEVMADSIFRKSSGSKRAAETYRIAPVPQGFRERFQFTRRDSDMIPNLDQLPNRARLIIRATRYRLGIDDATGAEGYAIQVSWPSLVSAGHVHIRDEIWQRL